MTKSRTKGQKLAERRRRIEAAGLPELAPTPKREKNGCFRDRTRQKGDQEKEPRMTVLTARAKQLGMPNTEAVRMTLTGHIFGDIAGQAIALGSRDKQEADRLWDVFWKLDRADATYHARILGRSRHAKCGKVEYMPERFEARADEASDYRTEEERDRSAVNAWMRWHGNVGHLAAHERTAIWDGVYLRCDLHRGGKLTTGGAAFVAAMRLLADVYEARKSA